MRYEVGDHLGVYPVNNVELVNKIGQLCGMDLDTVITLTNTDGTLILFVIFYWFIRACFFKSHHYLFHRGILEEASVPVSLQL